MKFSEKYNAYIKDNPNHYWFKRRLYGWGWMPVTWEGWLVLALFLCSVIWYAIELSAIANPTNWQITWYFIKIAFTVAVLILVCYKTGEKPKWMWGFPKDDEKQ